MGRPRIALAAALGACALAVAVAGATNEGGVLLSGDGLDAGDNIHLADNTVIAHGPPDTAGAVGPADYVEIVDDRVGMYDRRTLALYTDPARPTAWHRRLDQFVYRNSNTAPTDSEAKITQPQIFFDEATQRFYYAALREVNVSAATRTVVRHARVFYGWSTTSDPADLLATSWCKWVSPPIAEPDGWPLAPDFLRAGDADGKLVFTVVLYTVDRATYSVSTRVVGSRVWTVPKPADGDTTCADAWPETEIATLPPAADGGPVALVPVVTAAPSASAHLLAADRGASALRVWRLDGDALAELAPVGVPGWERPPAAAQPNGKRLATGDGRLTGAVAALDPAYDRLSLWTQHTVAEGGASAIRWYHVLPGDGLRQSGTVAEPGAFAFNGALSPSADGASALLHYDASGSYLTPQVRFRTREASMPLGALGPAQTVPGASYGSERDDTCTPGPCAWGLWAAAGPDFSPGRGSVVWGSNQYSGPTLACKDLDPARKWYVCPHWATRTFAADASRQWARGDSLAVTLGPLAATPRDGLTATRPSLHGATVTTRALRWSTPETSVWRVTLPPGAALQALPNGSVAFVRPAEDPGPDTPGDGDGVDPVDPSEEGDGDADLGDEPPVEDEVEDGSFDVSPDPDPAATADSERLLELLQAAEELTDDQVLAVAAGLVVRDAQGAAVPASLTVSAGSITLTISHRARPVVYPVTATVELVEEAAADEEALLEALVAPAATCERQATVVSYNPRGWQKLFQAFRDNATPCADYYIVIPPPIGKTDGKEDKRHVRKGVADDIRAAGANFHPVAEFNRDAWLKWAPESCHALGARCTGYWRAAGRTFRGELAAAGFRLWALNEVPSTVRFTAGARANMMALTAGLFYGRPGQSRIRGIVFNINAAQNTRADHARCTAPTATIGERACYKWGLKQLTAAKSFWNTIAPRVWLWGQEAYATCQWSCVGRNSPATRARYVNQFTMHPVRLANAGGAAGTAARAFYLPRYFPLLTAYWGSDFYGLTKSLTDEQMKALVSLQVYATRRFSDFNRYPGARIGFAWKNGAEPGFGEIAVRTAVAVRAAYGAGGQAIDACRNGEDADYWCTFSVGPKFAKQWAAFDSWD
jgi:hypothetical protein